MVERKESSGGGSCTNCPPAGIAARIPNSAARLLLNGYLPIDRVIVRKFKDNNFVVLEGGGIGLTLAREGRRRIEVGRRFDARHSELTGNTTFHDYASLALGINANGDVVGAS